MTRVVCQRCKELVEVAGRRIIDHEWQGETCPGSGEPLACIRRGVPISPGVELAGIRYIPSMAKEVRGAPNLPGMAISLRVNQKEATRVASNN